MTFADGRSLSDAIRQLDADTVEQLRLVEHCGDWLGRFHGPTLKKAELRIEDQLTAYADIQKQLEADQLQIATKHIVLRGITKLITLKPEFDCKPTMAAIQHGDIRLQNLVWDKHKVASNPIGNGKVAPVGGDIAPVLLECLIAMKEVGNLDPVELFSNDIVDAFFRGYRHVHPNDPSVRFSIYTSLLDALIRIPQIRSDRLPADHTALQKLRPMARAAFGISNPKRRKRSKPALHLYLTARSLARAQSGHHEIFNAMRALGQHHDFDVKASQNTPMNRSKADPKEKTLVHMSDPVGKNGLVFRRLYGGPFWQFDPLAARWNWKSAKARFDPAQVDSIAARAFFQSWQNSLYGEACRQTTKDGFIYMPLQGKLLVRRSFQTASPVEMIYATLRHSPLPIVATLHPNESYTQGELEALNRMQDENPRFRVHTIAMEDALARCDYVVTENSSTAFHALFFEKLAVLFAGIDFHHICSNIADLGQAAAFEHVTAARPEFERFLYWYWHQNAVNLESEHLVEGVTRKLSALGWEL